MTVDQYAARPPKLVIFDCDGVLVESEPLTSRAMKDVFAHYGLQLELNEVQKRFHGLSLHQTQDMVLAYYGVRLPDDIASIIEEAEKLALEDGLPAVPGIVDAVRSIVTSGIAICVGSNGSREAVAHRLKLTGLYSWFEGRLFSAEMVARGKPHPDVFLHAAETMEFSPSDCVVIEDSDAGVDAALAAGMRVLAYTASPTSNIAEFEEVERFTDMGSLPALLGIDDLGRARIES